MTTELTKAAPNNHGPIYETDLYDFAGWLTTRPGVMAVGSSCEAGPMAEAVGEYIKTFPERFALTQRPAAQATHEPVRLAGSVHEDNARILQNILDELRMIIGLKYGESIVAAVRALTATPDVPETDFGNMVTQQATPEPLTGCNCRWKGETQVEWCELHLAHKEAIHEWAERAKAAEAKLKATPEPVKFSHAGHFYNLVAHALMEVKRPDACAHRLRLILDELAVLMGQPATPPQQAAGEPVGEVVYQLQSGDGKWIDQTRASYDYNVKHGNTVRVLYHHPAPGVPEDVLAILDECQNALMECDRDGDYALIERIDALAAAQAKGADHA